MRLKFLVGFFRFFFFIILLIWLGIISCLIVFVKKDIEMNDICYL